MGSLGNCHPKFINIKFMDMALILKEYGTLAASVTFWKSLVHQQYLIFLVVTRRNESQPDYRKSVKDCQIQVCKALNG